MNFRDDMTERERFAEDHGYIQYRCPRGHGLFYSDSGPEGNCPSCGPAVEEVVEPDEGQFRCANCGEIFADAEKKLDKKFEYCSTCWLEFQEGESQ